ncbi:hypothetical protein NITMOv2_4692 [Nitrospira moscoviensis]|uniref:Uncharacterized protein n=1 Tax=Nitrospira moscoviensis TaxID=42253 RepID=A0A0K2GKC0_NITMO|nr:hypothetical protein NITMOv2_0090 [Nitrospira moscoviensis]ALA61062.1 hypothetical protein NITMOv2_4692 [Nitrospira moscoviensis]
MGMIVTIRKKTMVIRSDTGLCKLIWRAKIPSEVMYCSLGNDGKLKRGDASGFGGPLRKEWIDKAAKVHRRANRLRPLTI